MRKIAFLLFGLYLVAYLILRQTQAEVWNQDGQTYVIFPRDAVWTYYLFRPLSLLDATVTGMRFHIGPHN